MAPPEEKKVSVTFIVSGQGVTKEFPIKQPLKAAVQQVLADTKNTGQSIENWVLTFEGNQVDLSKTFEELGIKTGARLLLNVRAGRGGALS